MIATRIAEPSLGARETAFLEAISPALVDLDEQAVGAMFVGGQARFLAEQRHLDLLRSTR